MKHMQQQGITLLEVLVAAVIAAVVVGGTMTAFLTATRVSKVSSEEMGTAAYAQQTIERFRNKVACRQSTEDPTSSASTTPTWFDSACAPAVPSSAQGPDNWETDGDLSGSGIPGATRQYQVVAVDCNGDSVASNSIDDCLQVTSTVHWEPAQ